MKVTLNPIAITGLRNRIINRHETRKALTDILNSTPGLLNHLLEILNRKTNQKHKPTLSEDAKRQIVDKIKNRHQPITDKKPKPITEWFKRLRQNMQIPDFSGMIPRSLGIADFFSSIERNVNFYGTNLYEHFLKKRKQKKKESLLSSTIPEANTLLNTLKEKTPFTSETKKDKSDQSTRSDSKDDDSDQSTRSYSNDDNSVISYDKDEVYKSESESESETEKHEKHENLSINLDSSVSNVQPIDTLQVDHVQLSSRSSSSSIQPIFPSLNKPAIDAIIDRIRNRHPFFPSLNQPARNTIIDRIRNRHPFFPSLNKPAIDAIINRIRNRHPYLVPSLNQPAIDAIINRIHSRHPYLVQILQNTEEQANLLLESLDKPAKTYKLENITPILQSAEKDANDLLSALFKGPTGTTGTTRPTTGPTGVPPTGPPGTTPKTDNLNNLGELIINGEVFVMSPDGKSMIQKAIP